VHRYQGKLGLLKSQIRRAEEHFRGVFSYHVVRIPRIAIAIVLNRSDEVLMLWRYRVVTDQWGYELLGGLIEDGEEPASAVACEALEHIARLGGWI
jgi:8-oxo-dGTP pyrophosphatase MutT (NUDIX family)